MTQMKALDGAIAEIPCSVMAEMPTNSSKMHLRSILVNSAVCHIFVGKSEKMLLQSRKLTDRVDSGAIFFLRAEPFVEAQSKRKNELPFLKKAAFLILLE